MDPVQKVLPIHLQKLKEERRKITMLSIYDYAACHAGRSRGSPIRFCVGDSLAMTALGYPGAPLRSRSRRCCITRARSPAAPSGRWSSPTCPLMSYQVSAPEAVRNAGRFLKEAGADAVKLEGRASDRADA